MMQNDGAFTGAVTEISLSGIRVLVARCAPDALHMITEATTPLPLGGQPEADGAIAPETREAFLGAVRQCQRLAEQHRADPLLVVATEALHQAPGRQALLKDLERETGLHVTVLQRATEAALRYQGAASPPGTPPDAGVLEIGVESIQLVTARQRQVAWVLSAPIGAGWLHARYLCSNPPVPDEVARVEGFLMTYLSQIRVQEPPSSLMVTGAMAQDLFAMAKQVLKLSAHESRLTREDLLGCRGVVLALPSAALARYYRQPRERARMLPGTVLLLQAIQGFLGLEELPFSSAGVCEGVLLAYARAGARWLADPAVTPDAGQIGQAPPLPQDIHEGAGSQETFARSAREDLPKRAESFLNWRDDVLANEEVEAVHKMRVASRRLRAAMDAYQSVCQPKPFKQAYRTVKQAADRLGAARDTDVMTQQVEGLLKAAPAEEQAGMRWLLACLASYRQVCQRELEAFLSLLDAPAFQDAVASCLPKAASSRRKARLVSALDPQAPTGRSAPRVASLKLEELYRWNDAVDQPYAVRELHHLRIAAKRLRYTLEVFAAVLPDGCGAVIKELEQIQEELGQLHDCDVMIALLRLRLGSLEHPIDQEAIDPGGTLSTRPRPFLPTALVRQLLHPEEDCSAEQRYGLEQLVRQQEQRRSEWYSTFRQHWYRLQEQDMRRNLLTLLERGRATA
jgi:CHAD domain-containing protein